MKTLIIVCHPKLWNGSRSHKRMTEELLEHGITVHDLYKTYPDEAIDVSREQQLLESHDRIILQFPMWWYSSPSLLKKWMDEVLTFGWAYGPGGTKLHGKELGLAITTGSPADSYERDGYNHFTMEEFTRPFQVTFSMVGMKFLPMFTVHSAMNQTDEDLERSVIDYLGYVAGERMGERWEKQLS